MIPQHTIEDILQKSRIEEVVGDFLSLKKRGVNYLGNCPFHNEKTPSFTVSPTKNIFKCFGCGKAGNSVGFIMEHENYSYVEALKYLAAKYNIPIQEIERSPEQDAIKLHRESLLLINEFAGKHFHDNLVNKDYGRSAGLSYFKERGFSELTIEKFGLGYAYPDGHDLLEVAKINKYNADYLKELGLTTQNDRDFFVNRVMFPIYNLSGRIAGFGGRSLTSSEKSPKYLNSPDSEIYNKSRILYGFYQAKTAIKKEDNCYLVEGYTDVISMHQAGIEIAVASSGTSLTSEQAQLIKRFTDNVTLLFDGDSAGIKAAERGINILLEQNLNVHIAILPDGHDPDSYLKAFGAADLTKFISTNKKDFILFKAGDILIESANDPIKKVNLLSDIITSIAIIPDSLKRSVYISTCSKALDISESTLITEINKKLKSNYEQGRLDAARESRINQRNVPNPQSQPDKPTVIISENLPMQTLLKILILYGQNDDGSGQSTIKSKLIREINEDLEYIDHPLYVSIFEEFEHRDSQNLHNSADYYINHPNLEIQRLILSWIDPGYELSQNWEIKLQRPLQYQKLPEENYLLEMEDSLNRLRLFALNAVDKENIKKLKEISESGDMEELAIRLTTQREISKARKELTDKINMVYITKN